MKGIVFTITANHSRSTPLARDARSGILYAGVGFLLILACIFQTSRANASDSLVFFRSDHPFIQFTGRVDFTRPELPRFWQPGVYITTRFSGSRCDVILNDEMLWGSSHNYMEIVVDGKATRLRTNHATDTVVVADQLIDGPHTLVICKNTEANIGYLELVGIRCAALLQPDRPPVRRMEFIGNSITCGASSDVSQIPCGTGVWQDQHNAYESYGPVTARALRAQYQLSAVSGIGLVHSCCKLDILMPAVFDKVNMRNDSIAWDFSRYQPDVVTVCLGQNDGIQDSTLFCENYISFLGRLRSVYPDASIFCLTSPMADSVLAAYMRSMIGSIVSQLNKKGDGKVYRYFFQRQYHRGCDGHPDIEEHRMIARELTDYIRQVMQW